MLRMDLSLFTTKYLRRGILTNFPPIWLLALTGLLEDEEKLNSVIDWKTYRMY